MECMINLIVFSLIVVCSGNTVNIPINQHKCVVQGSSIECRFTVPGVYSPDRLLSTISSVEFDFFGKGCIQIEQKQMPDLTMVKIKQADDWKAVCLNIHVEQRVKVVVAGRECVSYYISIFPSCLTIFYVRVGSKYFLEVCMCGE